MKTTSMTTTRPTRISTSRLTAMVILPLDQNDAGDDQRGANEANRRQRVNREPAQTVVVQRQRCNHLSSLNSCHECSGTELWRQNDSSEHVQRSDDATAPLHWVSYRPCPADREGNPEHQRCRCESGGTHEKRDERR